MAEPIAGELVFLGVPSLPGNIHSLPRFWYARRAGIHKRANAS